MINPKIKDVLAEYKIPYNNGVSILLAHYYNVFPSYLEGTLVAKKVLATGIVTNTNKGLEWKIPLFEDQLNDWDWVKKYIQAFKIRNPNLPGSLTECTVRMKKFFAENPTVRVEDINNALGLYFASINDPKYIMYPHYFIFKDKGADKTSMLKFWLEEYYKSAKGARGRNSLSNTMK